MGEKKILTDEMIDEKLAVLKPQEVRFIDPMKLAQWSVETCCEMVDNGVERQTVMRAIASGDLDAYKAGKKVTIEPAKFLTWYRSFKK